MRPAVIVQDPSLSQIHGTTLSVPVVDSDSVLAVWVTQSSAQAKRPGAVPIHLNGLSTSSVAIPWQLRALDKRSFEAGDFLGMLSVNDIKALDAALRLYLGLL
ncbi:MAG: type II toxin-antitoxin system PemK/MazF family toxin [Firmicutes bacterium]|nr:type II toxin-antitoxin system PemK/MazF family toxin [Bacillota bacterium]